MKVFVNDKEVHLAPGMTVRHALVAAALLQDVQAGKKVCDRWDNEVGLDGALFEEYRLYVKEEKPL
jgi:hypothetical protein